MTAARAIAYAFTATALGGCVQHINVVNVGQMNGGTVSVTQINELARDRPDAPALEPRPAPPPPDDAPAVIEDAPARGDASLQVDVVDCMDSDVRQSFNRDYAESSDEDVVDTRTRIYVDGSKLAPGATVSAGKHELRVERPGCATESGSVRLAPGANDVDVTLGESFGRRLGRFDGYAAPRLTLGAGPSFGLLPASFDLRREFTSSTSTKRSIGVSSSAPSGATMAGVTIEGGAWWGRFVSIPRLRVVVNHAEGLPATRVDPETGKTAPPAGSSFDLTYFGLWFGGALRLPLLVFAALEADAWISPGGSFIVSGRGGADVPGTSDVLGASFGGKLRLTPFCGLSIAAGPGYAAFARFGDGPTPPGVVTVTTELAWHIMPSETCEQHRSAGGFHKKKQILE